LKEEYLRNGYRSRVRKYLQEKPVIRNINIEWRNLEGMMK
jgi:hypothetical protein